MSESGSNFNPEINKIVKERVELRPDIEPMIVEIVDPSEVNDELEAVLDNTQDDNSTWVDYDGGDYQALSENGFKHNGEGSYLISPIDEKDWFSDKYIDCTATVGIGRDVMSGKEVSFLSHQDPNYFIDGGEEQSEEFVQSLKDSLIELNAKCEPGTVEIVLLAGIYDSTNQDPDYKHDRYTRSIMKLREIIQDTLGFDPTVVAGPSNTGSTDVIVQTQKRKIFIQRDKQPEDFDKPFQANNLEQVEGDWNK